MKKVIRYHCLDCRILMDQHAYALHPADHTVEKIEVEVIR